jgi:hypothetical protein
MTTGEVESFGPYVYTLSPAETEAAAARFGLRAALRGGLILGHLAPLAAFALILLFVSILRLTDLIGRRAAEAGVLVAAAAFMIQRLAAHWRIRRFRNLGRKTMARLAADGALTARIDDSGVTLEAGGRSRRLDYVNCDDAEDAGGLVYLWPRDGPPIVLPARLFGEREARRFVARIKEQIERKQLL